MLPAIACTVVVAPRPAPAFDWRPQVAGTFFPHRAVDVWQHLQAQALPADWHCLTFGQQGSALSGNISHYTIKPEAAQALLMRVHSEDYRQRLQNEQGVPPSEFGVQPNGVTARLSRDWVTPALAGTVATYHAAQVALASGGLAVHLGGGYHHAYPNRAAGFCLVNDLAATIMALSGTVQRILLLDTDAHPPDGVLACLHEGWPIERQRPAVDIIDYSAACHQPTLFNPATFRARDCSLQRRCFNTETPPAKYYEMLEQDCRLSLERKPDLVLWNAGYDVLQGDPLGRLHFTAADIIQRDGIIVDLCRSYNVPLVVTLGGGYQPDATSVIKASWAKQLRAIGQTRPVPVQPLSLWYGYQRGRT